LDSDDERRTQRANVVKKTERPPRQGDAAWGYRGRNANGRSLTSEPDFLRSDHHAVASLWYCEDSDHGLAALNAQAKPAGVMARLTGLRMVWCIKERWDGTTGLTLRQ